MFSAESHCEQSVPAAQSGADASACAPEFLSALTHQLRNTVFGLTATIDLLEITVPQTPPFAQAATSMRLHTARLLRTLAELDAYGTAQAPPQETLDLVALLQRASAAVAGLAEERAVSLRMPERSSGGPAAVHAQPASLERAVRSLLEFAIVRSPARGTIDLSLRDPADGRVELHVEDQGAAIGPDLLSRALEPFAVRSGDLTGLSLPLAARVARAHGGELHVEETASGGILTRLALPCAGATPA